MTDHYKDRLRELKHDEQNGNLVCLLLDHKCIFGVLLRQIQIVRYLSGQLFRLSYVAFFLAGLMILLWLELCYHM